MAFTWSDWQRGIEPWRFNVPTSSDARPDERAHTIFDRTLLRAGETVSMKHLLRTETRQGFALPEARPDTLVITHVGSGQQFTQPLAWRNTATGGLSAQNTFAIPPAAKLGVYQVELRNESGRRAQLRLGRVPGGRVPPAGARRAHHPHRQKGAGARALGAHRCADQLRGRWRRGQPAGAGVGPGARQVAAVQRLRRLQLQPAAQARAVATPTATTKKPRPARTHA